MIIFSLEKGGLKTDKMFKVPPWVILSLIFISLFIAFFYILTFIGTRKNARQSNAKKLPSITFIIPSYNAAHCIKDTIGSITDADYPKEKIKILVVNDASTDDTARIVKRIMRNNKNVILLNKERGGKAAASNYGIARAKTELIAVLDADTIIKSDAIKKSVDYFLDNDVMAVTTRLIPLNKKGFFVRMQVIEYALTSFFRKLLSNINALPIAPAFTIYRASFFRKHGSFDVENLTEDFEMALRIHSSGYKIVYVLDSYAKTFVPTTFKSLYRQRVRWGFGTLYNLKKYKHLFSFKYGDLATFLLPTLVVGMAIVILAFLLAIYNFISGFYQLVRQLDLGWLPSFKMNLFAFLLSLSDPRIILGSVGLLISLIFIAIIKRETGSDIPIIQYFIYIIIYIPFLAYFYIVSIIRFIWKKPSW